MILIIETSAEYCSVALSDLTGTIRYEKKAAEINVHAEILPEMVAEAIGVAGNQLKAVALSKGPGSYTGLRIGTSLAKGICYSKSVPLISADGLKGLAFYAGQMYPDAKYIVTLLDARRDDAYAAVWNQENKLELPVHAFTLQPDSFNTYLQDYAIVVGNCTEKWKRILGEKHKVQLLERGPEAKYEATEVVTRFLQQEFEDTAYFTPFYLKDFIPGTAKKQA